MTTTTHRERATLRVCPDCGAPFSSTHGTGRCYMPAAPERGRFDEHDPRGPRAPTGVFLEVFAAIIVAAVVLWLAIKVLATYGLI